MMTAPERCPRETIFRGMPLSAKSITRGASMYAACIRPDIRDSLISGQPLYLLYWYSYLSEVGGAFAFAADLAVTATGNVRLQVTGKPPITNEFGFRAAHPRKPQGRVAANPCNTCRRETV